MGGSNDDLNLGKKGEEALQEQDHVAWKYGSSTQYFYVVFCLSGLLEYA